MKSGHRARILKTSKVLRDKQEYAPKKLPRLEPTEWVMTVSSFVKGQGEPYTTFKSSTSDLNIVARHHFGDQIEAISRTSASSVLVRLKSGIRYTVRKALTRDFKAK